jgi:hypothetical protein
MNKRMIKEKEVEVIKKEILIIRKITNIKELNNFNLRNLNDIFIIIYFN